MLYNVLLMKFIASPRHSLMIRAASTFVTVVLMASCGGGTSDNKPAVTTTSSVAPKAKNAALNWSVNTPGGYVCPGGVTPKTTVPVPPTRLTTTTVRGQTATAMPNCGTLPGGVAIKPVRP